MAKELIDLQKVGMIYEAASGPVEALADISLAVGAGEFVEERDLRTEGAQEPLLGEDVAVGGGELALVLGVVDFGGVVALLDGVEVGRNGGAGVIGGFAFGHWVTSSDPAFLRILAKSERYKLRYDAAKQSVPRVEVA